MTKVADFATYKMVKNLSFNDFNRWVLSIYNSGYEEGQHSCNDDCMAALTDERLLEIILSVKGIGKNRAIEVLKKISEEGVTYGIKT